MREQLQEFTASLQFIVFFIILVLIINMVFGDGLTIGFLTLVLLSMIVINAGKFTDLVERFAAPPQ